MDFRLTGLPVVETDLAVIDLDDDTNRIARAAESPGLSLSIGHLGMLHPSLLKPSVDHLRRWQIVAGFKRVSVCRELGWRAIPARVLPDNLSGLQCAQLAIADNALARPLTVMERARALALLRPLAADAKTLTEILPSLGMTESPATIDKLMRLGRQPTQIQQAIEEDQLSLAMALDLADEASAEAIALCDLFVFLRLGLNRQRELLGLLRDISRRDDVAITDLIRADAVREMLKGSESERPRIVQQVIDYFKRLRYPIITTTQNQRQRLIADLDLPAGVSLRPPPSFEDSTYTLIIQFSAAQQLKQRYQKLHGIVHSPAIGKLTDI